MGPKIQRVGLDVRSPCGFRYVVVEDGHFEHLNYGASDLILDLEYIGQRPVECRRPNLVAVVDSYELCGNPQRITRLADSAFE